MPTFPKRKKRIKRSKVSDYKNPSSTIKVNNSGIKKRKSTNRRSLRPKIKLPKFKRVFNFRNLLRPKMLIFILIFGLLIAGGVYAYSNIGNFYIKQIEINQTRYLDQSLLNEIQNNYSGKIFFTVFPRTVAEDISKSSPIVKSVEVEKFLPDKLNINIEEREPFSIWINRDGAYLISKDNVVLEKLAEFNTIEFSTEDLAILSDAAAINPPTDTAEEEVKNENESNSDTTETPENKTDPQTDTSTTTDTQPEKELTEEEKKALEEEQARQAEIDRKQKIAILEARKRDLETQLNNTWKENLKDIDKTIMNSYLQFYSYESKSYKPWDSLNEDTLKAFELARELSKIKLLGDFNHFLWINEHHLQLVFSNDKKLILDPYSYNDDLYSNALVVIEDLKKRGEGFRTIDLRGEKIAVR